MNCSSRNCNEKIWVEDFFVLLERQTLIPSHSMSRNEKVNTITRLILLIFIVMVILKYPHSLNFLSLSIIIILILYFLRVKENFGEMDYHSGIKNPLIAQNSRSSQKMSTAPIIVPRAHERDVWSFPSYRHSAVNYNNGGYDISEEYAPVPQRDDYKEYDPRMESYTNFNLDSLQDVCKAGRENVPSSSPLQAPRSSASGNRDVWNPSYLHQGQYSTIPETKESQYSLDGMTDLSGQTENETTPSPPSREGFGPQPHQMRQTSSGFQRERFSSESTPIENVTNNTHNAHNTHNSTDHVTLEKSETPLFPSGDLLIPRTITSIYGRDAVSNSERTKYLQNIQPTQYSYSDVAYPINANLGISYTPDIPPMVLDQVVTPQGTYPLYHRIDPQLIRAQGISDQRREELPYRNKWSARYSGFDAAPGTVNFEDIYDPRFTSYGDENRSYGDVQLGQVQYYYSDIDAYRSPNFGIRTKVDHIEYVDPMGKVIPEYARNVGVNDIKKSVHDQYNSDAMYFREGLQERLMKKRNSELWQLRAAPVRKGGNAGTFTSNY